VTIAVRCQPDFDRDVARSLRTGDELEISGRLVTIRDATAKRLLAMHEAGDPLPIDLTNTLLYAVGPSPAKPGQIVGSAGPTTTERFVAYLPFLFSAGARGIIGKGELHGAIVGTFVNQEAVYLVAIGGLGALLGKHVVAVKTLAFPELGPEALFEFEVSDFPAVVAIDSQGANLHETARARWRRPTAI
jgi:fumarate hydratase subunit beta